MVDQVSTSEVDIRNLLAAGDPAAFKRLYNQNRNHVYDAAYAVLKSREEALETLQEIFLKAWQIRENFEKVESLEKYLYVMARNKALSRLIKRKRELHFLLHESWEVALAPCPHSIMESKENDDVYSFLLQRLTERQRTIFKMAREEKMSHDAIAKILDISPNTVNNHIKAALATIRNLLGASQADSKEKSTDQ